MHRGSNAGPSVENVFSHCKTEIIPLDHAPIYTKAAAPGLFIKAASGNHPVFAH